MRIPALLSPQSLRASASVTRAGQRSVLSTGPSFPSEVFGQEKLQFSARAIGNLPGPMALNSPQEIGDPNQAYRIEAAKIEHIGPRLESLPDFQHTPLRIALETDVSQTYFRVDQAHFKVVGPAGETDLGDLSGAFEIRAQPQGFALYQDQKSLGTFQGRLEVSGNRSPIQVNGQLYRGNLELLPDPQNAERLQVINTVLLEDYLKSVVPSESPASWPQESLKAQALAARTYAVANWGKHSAEGYDMKDDTSDQMYKGLASEHPNANAAVEATQGQILVSQGRPITALFFSCSGGYTDSALEVWGQDLPYIQPVPDFDQAASRYRWKLERSQQDLQTAAQKLGLNLGQIRAVEPLTHTPQGRVKTLRLVGSQDSALVDANQFRFAAHLYSTLWQVQPSGSGSKRQFEFSGGGWGHGLGMSQWGARQLALNGKSAAEIVKYYYRGIEIQDLNASPAAAD